MDDGDPPHAHVVRLDAERRRRRPTPVPGASEAKSGASDPRGLLYRVAAAVVAAGAVASLWVNVGPAWAAQGREAGTLRVLARAAPLAVGACVHLFVFAPASLLALTLTLGFVHLFDFFVGIVSREPVQVGVPLVFGVATFASAIPQVAEAAFPKARVDRP